MMILEFGWQAFVILFLVLANGFFVAAEFAIVKIRASQLKPLAKSGDWRVPIALKAVNNLDACLSATQLGITLSSLGLGWLGEEYVSHWLKPIFLAFGVTNEAVIHSVSVGIAFSLITFLHIVLGELAPKSLAIQRPKPVSLWVAAPLMVFYWVLYPFIYVLNGTANAFLRLAGLRPATEGEHNFSPDELEYVLSHSRHTHVSDALINKIMVRSLRLRDVTAQQVMLPRDQVTALWTNQSVAENLHTAQSTGHSRYPVCDGSLDNIIGLVLIKEWLWQLQALGPDTPFQPLIRPVLTFTARTTLPSMIELFRSSRSHLAVVLDEQANMAGIVTFEDALEEIVGEIRDELDIEKGPIYEQTENSIVVDAKLSVRELRAETGWNFEYQPRETVEKWIIRHAERIPVRNDELQLGEFRIDVLLAHTGGLRRVRVTRVPEVEEAD